MVSSSAPRLPQRGGGWHGGRNQQATPQQDFAMTAIVRLGDILHAAISRGDAAKAIELLEHGAPVNERRDHGTTPLHWASSEDYVDIVEALLAHGADPNVAASDGCTPLHSLPGGRRGAVAALLRGGAAPTRSTPEVAARRRDLRRHGRRGGRGYRPDAEERAGRFPGERRARLPTSGTGTDEEAGDDFAVVVSRESVSPLEVAMADLAWSWDGRSPGERWFDGGGGRAGGEAGDGVAHRRGDRRGGRREVVGSGRHSRRVAASGPEAVRPAADHDVSAPERAEARAVVVCWTRTARPGDVRRHSKECDGPARRLANATARSIPEAGSPGLRSADGRRGVRARWRRRRIRRGLIGTGSRSGRAPSLPNDLSFSPRQLSFKHFLTREAQLRTMSIPMSERPAAQVSTSGSSWPPHPRAAGGSLPTPSLRP